MTNSDALDAFFHREGAYELCAALLDETRTRQALIELIDTSERTLDRRISDARDLSLVTLVPTTEPERVIALEPDVLPEPFYERCTVLLDYHRSTAPADHSHDASFRPLHRNNLNETQHREAPLQHANAVGGDSSFIRRR